MLTPASLITVDLKSEWVQKSAEVKKKALEALNGRETRRFDAQTDYAGWLAERAFSSYISESFPGLMQYTTWANEEGESFENYDFKIHSTTIDIKAALPKSRPDEIFSKLHYYDYMYPATQEPLTKDYITLVYLWPDLLKAIIVGIISGKSVAQIPIINQPVRKATQIFEILNHKIGPIASKFENVATVLHIFCEG